MSQHRVVYVCLVALLVASCATRTGVLADKNRASAAAQQAVARSIPKPALAPPELRTIEREPPVDLGPATDAASSAMQNAVARAGERVVGWWDPLPEQPSFAALLDPDREMAHPVSLGTVGSGELHEAAKIELVGEHHSVIERHRGRHTQYGSGALINVIVDSAAAVGDRFPGTKLRVGNMSRKRGGDIPWSSSHNSGRDADLAFYCKRKKDGEVVPAPDLLAFDSSGQAIKRPDLVFDVARNWALVEAMLTHERVGIQWLFVSNPLKRMLLEHARKTGVDPLVVARAEKVLHQPTDAAPHNDHFHLRITCPRRDRLEGCLDFGPRWEWVDWHYDDLLARSMALAKALRQPKVQTRLEALDFLARIRSPYAPEIALAAALHDDSDEVRRRALEVAASVPSWSGTAVDTAMRFVESNEFSVADKAYAYSVLRRSVDGMALEVLRRRVADDKLSVSERVYAARALTHFMEPDLVPFLLEQLGTQPSAVRAKLAVSLRRVTNRAEAIDWQRAAADARKKALSKWQDWWKKNRKYGRDDWLEAGFVAQGLSAEKVFEKVAVKELIKMLGRSPDHVAYNANLTLKRITGRWAPLEAWSNRRLHRYWSKWWRSTNPDEVAIR